MGLEMGYRRIGRVRMRKESREDVLEKLVEKITTSSKS